jgi:tRNA A37 N6-isopentenylltransferase MiaA
MAEKQLRKKVAELLKGHTSQVESHETAAGIPDTNNHFNGQESWLELKFTTGSKAFKVRKTQMTWFRRRRAAGVRNTWILWRREDKGERTHGIIHMVGPRVDAVLRDRSPSFWAYSSAHVWHGELDADTLNTILRNTEHE